MSTAFASFVAAALTSEPFTLVDVGCSGGLEAAWRAFGDRLRAVGFDASAEECRRLAALETNSGVRYVAGFAGISPGHPFAIRDAEEKSRTRDPWYRLSVSWALELREKALKAAPMIERLQHNAWETTELADSASQIVVPDALARMAIGDVDLLKIDIDGDDFRVLNSFDDHFDRLGLLAARLEVNFYSVPGETMHTFNNTDRFMRDRGFDLIGLNTRLYSRRALPAPFAVTVPGESKIGRTYQGDAFYARDLASSDRTDEAAAVSPEKLAKLAAILSVWNQPDGAAEILQTFRSRLDALMNVDAGLDLLAAQIQHPAQQPLSYKDYIASFEADPKSFYAKDWVPPPPRTLARRVVAASKAFLDPHRLRSREN